LITGLMSLDQIDRAARRSERERFSVERMVDGCSLFEQRLRIALRTATS
jgi:hypothetical protein